MSKRSRNKTEEPSLTDRLRALETAPPNKANRLIARHLKCATSQKLSDMLAEAIRVSSYGRKSRLRVPSALLPPLA
jgi:hypothetical protein